MSRHICVRCACGEVDTDASDAFTTVVWYDLLDSLASIGVERPYHTSLGPLEVDGDEFHQWWSGARERMSAARERLPTLYQIWEDMPGTQGQPLRGSAAAYFLRRGDTYMTEAVYDRLTARRLPPGPWEERRASWVRHDRPGLEEAAPEVDAALPLEDEVTLDAETFERIFRDTPAITLEHGNLLDFFARELAEIDTVARHAAERGELVTLYEY